ncbi:hypothetical protein ACOZ38_03225 [Sphaerisporangium viridialbum]|uniref:hypothetical protein n=1 Tax=Sphaerisporangium viridialbum TaxID=46189 RepID=UPI003C78B97F
MGEFVGVDPANLRELASRLQRLHTLLAEHGPLIQQKMQKWDSEVSFAALPRLIDEALNDARDMDARTTKAYELAHEKGWSPFQNGPADGLGGTAGGLGGTAGGLGGTAGNQSGGPVDSLLALDRTPPPMVRLDWTTTGQGGYQAKQDAKALAEALTTKDPAQARNRIALLPESLARHANDKAYLATFWTEACPLALQAARALYNRAGTALFSTESASLLRALGASLASATQMRVGTGKDRRPLLSEATRAAITKNADPWSVGMLFKYGPDGKTWDSHFLADITRSMLDARAALKIEIPSVSDQGGDLIRQRALYQKRLAEFDPCIAVMDRATQNGQAARHVLGDPTTGLRYAKMLVSDDWHTPGVSLQVRGQYSITATSLPLTDRFELSSHAADFLKAAASAGRGASEDAKESAWSVVNIVKATAEFSRLKPDAVLPNEIRKSLIFTTDRYLPDFARSVGRDYGSGILPKGRIKGNPWMAIVQNSELEALFNQILREPKEYGAFKGIMDARVAAAVTANILDPSDQNYLSEMGRLYGLVQQLEGDRNFINAQHDDDTATRNQTALSMLVSGFGALSFANPWGPATIAQFLTGVAGSPANQLFDTGHALETLHTNAAAVRSQVFHVEIPVVQGLLNAGAITPPKDALWVKDGPQGGAWIKNGIVIPNQSFLDWASEHDETQYAGKSLGQWVNEARNAMGLQ